MMTRLALPSGGRGHYRKLLKNKHKSASLLWDCYHVLLPPKRSAGPQANLTTI